MDARTADRQPNPTAASSGQAPPLVRDLAEIARWGRLLGRLDARERTILAPGAGGAAHAAAFRRSSVWVAMDPSARNVFAFAHRQASAEWARRDGGAPVATAG
jgi:hypothetical protein